MPCQCSLLNICHEQLSREVTVLLRFSKLYNLLVTRSSPLCLVITDGRTLPVMLRWSWSLLRVLTVLTPCHLTAVMRLK